MPDDEQALLYSDHEPAMKFFDRLANALSWTTGKRLAGRDLQGNKYYEIANAPGGGRPKRSIKYRKLDHLSDYTSGKLNLPIQWASWLRHTRLSPPTMDELQSDTLRQSRLGPMVDAINERERLERIRQGYAIEGDRRLEIHSHSAEYEALYGSGAGPSTARVESKGLRSRQLLPSVQDVKENRSAIHGEGFEQRAELDNPQTYPVPTPPSPGLSPPSSVDPSRHSSKEDLRRLSEEDTKRRMAEAGVPAQTAARPVTQPTGGLKPRRRGAAFNDSS